MFTCRRTSNVEAGHFSFKNIWMQFTYVRLQRECRDRILFLQNEERRRIFKLLFIEKSLASLDSYIILSSENRSQYQKDFFNVLYVIILLLLLCLIAKSYVCFMGWPQLKNSNVEKNKTPI